MEVLIVGSGPAALMCATALVKSGKSNLKITIVDKKKGPGRKFLIAGSSGLNISYDAPDSDFHEFYESTDPEFFKSVFVKFSKKDWIEFVNGLGIETFTGTSRRLFVKGMKAAPLLRAWTGYLSDRGVHYQFSRELADFKTTPNKVEALFEDGSRVECDALVLALGGASYEKGKVTHPAMLKSKGIGFSEFAASNVGFEVAWSEAFIKEAEGKPLKNVVLKTSRGERQGDLVVTKYGLEGTPVYSIGEVGPVTIDLLPDLSEDDITAKLNRTNENLSPIRRVKKNLSLNEAALALLFHHGELGKSETAGILKNFKLEFKARRPIEEAISVSGGVRLNELDANLMLQKFDRVFIAGEMIDFDTTTGGFLIQAAVSTGYAAGLGVLERLFVT